jgi:O-acetyl-ADP-ribose deacetylase (regulator of RNase III)
MSNNSFLRVILVDVNRRVVQAWRDAFVQNPEVEIVHGSMLEQRVDAWVTPTNARGSMDGGLDAVLRRHFGPRIEKAVQQEIGRLYQGAMPIGCATCVPTGGEGPRFLISTPTMTSSVENVSQTINVALACAATFQAIHQQEVRGPGSITSVALPGLGAATGGVPVKTCAELMWTGYTLFHDHSFRDFGTMRATLLAQLGGRTDLAEDARVRFEFPEPDMILDEPWPPLK